MICSEQEALEGDTLLHVRDTRFGWLHYQVTRDDTRKLAALLMGCASLPAPATGSALN